MVPRPVQLERDADRPSPEDEPESTTATPSEFTEPSSRPAQAEARPKAPAGQWRAVRSPGSDGNSRELANAGAK